MFLRSQSSPISIPAAKAVEEPLFLALTWMLPELLTPPLMSPISRAGRVGR